MKYTYSPQKGKPGHCFQAQIWDEYGSSIAVIESNDDEKEANKIVKLFAESPEIKEQHGKMLELLKFELKLLYIDLKHEKYDKLKISYGERIKIIESLINEIES